MTTIARTQHDQRLARFRTIAPAPTPERLRALAIDLVRAAVEREDAPESILRNRGGGGPAWESKPAYSYAGHGTGGAVWDAAGTRHAPKRGEIAVAMGDRDADRLAAVFRIADLAAGVRSGAVQPGLFEVVT